MKNKSGMVVAEVLVALIVCGIILTISIHMFKSNDLSRKPFVYSVIKNLPMVNTVIENDCYQEGTCSEKRQLPSSLEEYCIRLTNNLTTTGDIDCLPSSSTQEDYRTNGDIKYYYNFRMSNGVAFYGLTKINNGSTDQDNVWQQIGSYSNEYIDILVDLNGPYGGNSAGDEDTIALTNGKTSRGTFGNDVIPIRIFKNGDVIPGLISGDSVTTAEQYYNNTDFFGYNVVLNEYDNDNTNNNGSLKTNSIDLRTQNEINANEPPKFTVSFREAVCRAYNNQNNNSDGKADEMLTRYYGERNDYWCDLDSSQYGEYGQSSVCANAETHQNQHCTVEIAKPKSSAFARLFGL